MSKTINEIKNDFLRDQKAFEIKSKLIEREIQIVQTNSKKLNKTRRLAKDHFEHWMKQMINIDIHLGNIQQSFERLSKHIQIVHDSSETTEMENVVELRPISKE